MAQIDTRRSFSTGSLLVTGLLGLACLASVGCAAFQGAPSSQKQPPPPAASYSISGTIGPVASGKGAMVTLNGPSSAVILADAAGNYTFQGLADGVYTVTVAKAGSKFNPATQAATVKGSSIEGVNFHADLPVALVTISGTISPAASGKRAKVTLSGASTATAIADSAGNYSFSGLNTGAYTVTPSKAGMHFSPLNRTVAADTRDVDGIDFHAGESSAVISISGTISPANLGNGATITLSGAANAITKADSSGNYTFTGLLGGVYTISPNKTGTRFNPPSRTISADNTNVGAVNFRGNAAPVSISISGTISPVNQGAGVVVVLSGTAHATTTADSLGNFAFSDLSAGPYTVTPNKTGQKFAPAMQQVTAAASNVSGVNFSAGSSVKTSGPIVISGQSGTVIQGLKITSTTGDCVTINNSTNITIQNSEIGPCAGNGIKISGGSGIKVFDSYIHPETQSPGCCDHNDGIYATKGPTNLWIQGNVIAYGESNIEVQNGQSVYIIGNLLLNPRGPYPRGQNFQCWNYCSGVSVQNNYALSSTDTSAFLYPDGTMDSLNFGLSDSFVVQNNFISGGHSSSGCGIMADTKSTGGQILQNRLLDTGQCGIGLTDGTHTATGNLVYNSSPVPGGGNTAMYVAHYGKSSLCGPMIVTDNIADELQDSGAHSGWWNKGDCGPISIGTNHFGTSADTDLTPRAFSPPLIPPQPRNCVAFSPYSNQTSAPACAQ